MKRTEYSVADTEDLIDLVLSDAHATSREVELAQRLMLAVDMLDGSLDDAVAAPAMRASGGYDC